MIMNIFQRFWNILGGQGNIYWYDKKWQKDTYNMYNWHGYKPVSHGLKYNNSSSLLPLFSLLKISDIFWSVNCVFYWFFQL